MGAEEQGYHASRELIYYHLQEYTKRKDLLGGRRILSAMICDGLESISVLGDHLIRLFAACGNLMEANYVFYAINRPTIFTWNSIISAHLSNGDGERALVLYQEMQHAGAKADTVTFLGALKLCGRVGSICQGRLVHDQIILSNFEADPSIGNSLVDMYANCGSLLEAYSVFVRLVNHSVVSWTIMISACAQCNAFMFALYLYDRMLQEEIKPNKFTFMATLKACIANQSIEEGKIIHDHIIKSGCIIDRDLGSTIVDMYSKCWSPPEARKVFDAMPNRDVVSWGVLIAGYAQHDGFSAIKLYKAMQKEGLKPDKFIYSSVLIACACVKAVELRYLIYKEVLEDGLERDLIVGTALVRMHAEFGDTDTAQKMFEELTERNEVSWGALIKGHVQQEHDLLALQLYEKMLSEDIQPSKSTHVCILKACVRTRALIEGWLIHDKIVRSNFESDTVIGSSIIEFYAQSGYFSEAHVIFDKMQNRDTMAWGVLYEGYLQHDQVKSALALFEYMQSEDVKADTFIWTCLLKACYSAHHVRLLHDQIVGNNFENDVVVGNTLIDMYAKYGSLQEMHMVFERLLNRDAVSWTALMGAFANHGRFYSAFGVFEEMRQAGVQPTEVTYLCLLKACTIGNDTCRGRLAHDELIRSGIVHQVVVGNALVYMYATCGHVEDAQNVFDGLNDQDEVSWGALIAAYSQHELDVWALELFGKMQRLGPKPNKAILLCTLKACSNLGTVVQGKLIHCIVIEDGLDCDQLIVGALLYMYAKCGCIAEAREIFRPPWCQDVTLWGTLISHCGNADLARELFVKMQRQGMKPNTVLFTNIITTCSHEGLLEEGQGHFELSKDDDSIASNIVHYTTMADLLSRTGHLQEAFDFFHTMPMPPDVVAWRSLLSSCKLHEGLHLGSCCFDQVAGEVADSAHMIPMPLMCKDLHKCNAGEPMPLMCKDLHKWNAGDHVQEPQNRSVTRNELEWVGRNFDEEACEFVDGEDIVCAEKALLVRLERLRGLNKGTGGLSMSQGLADFENCGKFLDKAPLNTEVQFDNTIR